MLALYLLPLVIKSLGVIGTIALLMVSGDIFVHNIDYLHHMLPSLPGIVKSIAAAIVGGLLALGLVTVGKALFGKKEKAHA